MIKFRILLLFVIISSVTAAQNKKFYSINNIGILSGQSGSSGTFQTINGFQTNKWFYGIGVGIDPYHFLSYPVFIDVRKYISPINNIFVYGDIGSCFPGKNTPGPQVEWFYSNSKFYPGITFEIGTGYSLKLGKKTSVIFSAGYSYKEIKNKVRVQTFCPFIGPCTTERNEFKYKDGRLTIKTGFVF